MNLYFDIDGVLKGAASPKADIEALILYCIQHYLHTTYWLTTHCKGGINRTRSALLGVFRMNGSTRLKIHFILNPI